MILVLSIVGFALLAAACGSGDSSGAQTRSVLVDYQHDEFASTFIAYFPKQVTLHPGDTVVFEQQWSGEPHSVTMGTLVDDMMGVVVPLFEKYEGTPEEEIPPKVFKAFEKAMKPLPWMMGEDNEILQNAAQPCYLDSGRPPADPDTPCDDADQRQPAFNGRQSYYNSGFISYQGPEGNEFRVQLADDIAPGDYYYYCNLHGPGQSGKITVAPRDEEIPTAAEVAAQTREEIDEMAEPLLAAYKTALAGEAKIGGKPVTRNLAGWTVPDETDIHGAILEYIPKTLSAKAGEKVTWQIVGGHTVSFDVPPYFAHVTVEDDGTVKMDPRAFEPVNSPPLPEGGPDGPPQTPTIDAGTWDGSGFLSSGMIWGGNDEQAATYSVTFTEPGTYPYACLIHPQMVGEVVVEG